MLGTDGASHPPGDIKASMPPIIDAAPEAVATAANDDGFTPCEDVPTRNLYAVTQHLLTRRNFLFLNSPRGFQRSLEERSHNFSLFSTL